MTITIRHTLAQLPGVSEQPALTWPDVARHLREHYIGNANEKKRRDKWAERQRFYQSGGDSDVETMLSMVFRDPEVIEKRRQWIEYAKFNNVVRRITHEVATVYSQPARRTVSDKVENEKYQTVQRMCRQDEVMQRVNRLAFLHRAVVVYPRMRMLPNGEWHPVIDVITPAKFYAVRHPMEPTLCLGIIFESDYEIAHPGYEAPKYQLVTWHETISFNSLGEAIESTHFEHGIGRIPALLFTIEPPDGKLLDDETGDDLIAAQKAVRFLDILHLKEAKSATKQTVIMGDISRATRNQVDDSEVPATLPEGVTVTQHDRAMDFTKFHESARAIVETAGTNYGLVPDVMKGASVASADARDLQRIPLREIRLQQQVPFREFEREFVELQAVVVAQRRPDLAFDTAGWSLDFADPQTPLGTKEALEVFKDQRALSLTSTKREVKRQNPDLDDDGANEFIAENIADELERNMLMRPLQMISGSPDAESPGGHIRSVQAAQDNSDQPDDDMTETPFRRAAGS